mmetsp:Transcript_15309/g.37546  ORF Transcript_15309/g.37546 Transcript_15309/m.37546 type:complete len:229 (+) Transcript_15309:3-689(+)
MALTRELCENRIMWHLGCIKECMQNMTLAHRYKSLVRYKDRAYFKMNPRFWMRHALSLPPLPNSLEEKDVAPEGLMTRRVNPGWNYDVDRRGNRVPYEELGVLAEPPHINASREALETILMRTGENLTQMELDYLAWNRKKYAQEKAEHEEWLKDREKNSPKKEEQGDVADLIADEEEREKYKAIRARILSSSLPADLGDASTRQTALNHSELPEELDLPYYEISEHP